MVDWRDYVTLKDNEYVVEDCNLPREQEQRVFDFPLYGFVLTNQRLIVLRKNFTEDRKITSFELEKEFPLECIKDVAGDHSETIIYTDGSKYNCGMHSGIHYCSNLPWTVANYDRLLSYFRNKVIQQKEKKMVVLDFSSLRSLMEKGGIVLTTLRCPHCNASIKLPEDGTETVCEHCRCAVYAQDIFEKEKALIG